MKNKKFRATVKLGKIPKVLIFTSSIKKVLIIYSIWRILLTTVAMIGPKFIPLYGNKFPYIELLDSFKVPYWVQSFGNFDGVHYLIIARDGYTHEFTQAFFPFYPLSIRVFSKVFDQSYLTAGLIISNLSFLIALIVFFKLLQKHYGEKVAFWSCLFLVFFPTSFYFGAIYTESLFFLFTMLAFYLIENEKYVLASIVGFFAASTRLIGVLLSISLSWKKPKMLVPLFIVPLGLVFYMIYLKLQFDNPIYFLTAQSAYEQNRSTTKIILLPQVLYRAIAQVLTTHGLVLYNSAQDLLLTILALSLLIISFKYVKKNWVTFSLISILIPTLTGSLISMPRYVLLAFPIYIVLAKIKNNFIKVTILLIFISILCVNIVIFTRGYWVA